MTTPPHPHADQPSGVKGFGPRLMLLAASLAALSVIAMGLWTWVDQRDRLRQALVTRSTAALHQLAIDSAAPTVRGDLDDVASALMRAAAAWVEAQDLRVVSQEGLPLVHVVVQAGKAPRRVTPVARQLMTVPRAPQPFVRLAVSQGQDVLQLWSPLVTGATSAWVYAEVSTQTWASFQRELVTTGALVAVLAALAGAAMAHLLWRRPTEVLDRARRLVLRQGQAPRRRGALSGVTGQHHPSSEGGSNPSSEARDGAAAVFTGDAKARFLAQLGHDLRTPLSAVIGLTELTLQTSLQDRQRAHLGKVHQSAKSLLATLNDRVDMCRIEAGQLTLEVQPFRGEDLLDDVAEALSFRAEDQGSELLMDRRPEVPDVLMGDSRRLRQLLVNLGSSVLQLAPAAEVVISVSAEVTDSDAVTLRCLARAVGLGQTVAPDAKALVPADGGSRPLREPEEGTGLARAFSTALVDLMGGQLSWTHHEGRGSAVEATLPFRRPGPPSSLEPKPAADQALDPMRLDLAGLRCLLVDDSATALEIGSRMLSRFGLQVDTATTAVEALMLIDVARTSSSPYELVLLDWRMPHLDGLSAATRIRQRCGAQCPQLVLLTAGGAEEAQAEARRQGVMVDGFLSKPVMATPLARLLNQLLSPTVQTLPRPAEERWASEPAGALSGLRLLVVEDSEVSQEVARATLEMHGADVVLASDGQKAVHLLNAMADRGVKLFDAVLMDCQMPHLNGYEATRALRAQARFGTLPIIAMTAEAMEPEVRAMQEAGMDGHVPKPFQVETLLGSILRHTSDSRVARR